MKLTEVFARKTYGDPDNDSEQNAKDYIRYAKDGPISGTSFSIRKDHVVIYQELDDEEEPDKYIVVKSEIRPQLWKNFLKVAKAATGTEVEDDDYWAKENERIRAGEEDYRRERATKRLVRR